MLSSGRKSLRHVRTQLERLNEESLQILIYDYLEGKPYLGVFERIFGIFFPFPDERDITRREYLIAREILEKRQRN